MGVRFNTALCDRDPEVDVEVEYHFRRGCRGSRDSLGGKRGAGPPLEPDEPDEIEIESIKDEAGKEMECTDAELETILEEAWDDLGGRDD